MKPHKLIQLFNTIRVLLSQLSRNFTNLRLCRWISASLSRRITILMAVIVAIMMGLLSMFVTANIRDGMFEERIDAITQDAAIRVNSAQSTLDQVKVDSIDQVQDTAYQIMNNQRQSAQGAGGVSVMLLRPPTSQSVINEVVQRSLLPVVSKEILDKVEQDKVQHWQSVALPNKDGSTSPGVVVVAPLTLPLVGMYEMVIIYTLQPEQATIDMIVQILVVGSLALLGVLMIVIWGVSYQTTLPIMRAASTAKQITGGDLDARVHVEGHDELASLATSFNGMADALQQQINNYAELAILQQRFVSDVSHELRTPMTTIRIASDLFHESIEDLPPHMRRSAEILYDQVDRFDRMLADLLEISRFDARTALADFDLQDLGEIVRKVIDATAPLAEELGVAIEATLPSPVVAEVDDIRIERIVRNLIVNALEHAEGNPVRVRLMFAQTSVAIQVRDWGVGMTDQVATHVFDRFYRADPSRARKSGGTGLGMAIAAEDAAMHNGVLTVLGCPEHGTSFLLVIPRKQEEEITDLPAGIIDEELMEARAAWAIDHPEDISGNIEDDIDDGVNSINEAIVPNPNFVLSHGDSNDWYQKDGNAMGGSLA